MRVREGNDHRVIDAIARWRVVTTPDVANEVRIRIAPVDDRVVRAHHRRPRIRILIREKSRVSVVMAEGGQAHA